MLRFVFNLKYEIDRLITFTYKKIETWHQFCTTVKVMVLFSALFPCDYTLRYFKGCFSPCTLLQAHIYSKCFECFTLRYVAFRASKNNLWYRIDQILQLIRLNCILKDWQSDCSSSAADHALWCRFEMSVNNHGRLTLYLKIREKGTDINKRLETDRQTVKLSLLYRKVSAWKLHHLLLSVDPRSRYCERKWGKKLACIIKLFISVTVHYIDL